MADIKQLNEFPEYAPILAFWAFREWYGNRSMDFGLVLKAYQDRINNEKLPVTWIAVEKTVPVGMVSLKTNDLWSRKDLNPWLSSLFVLHEYRKRGIGTQLVNSAVKGAATFDYKIIYLFADKDRTDLYDYYKKLKWNYLDTASGNDDNIVNIFYYNLI